jgi:nitroreductase
MIFNEYPMHNTIFNHRSIRNYKSDPIPEPLLDEILRAGSRASTTGNMQVYSIVVTTDESLREKLWDVHFKQNMVRQAPVVLTFCADFNRFNIWCRQRKAEPGYDNFLSFITAFTDALLAAQNCALAAEEAGLGICYLGTTTYNADKIIEILQLPEFVVPATTLVMGYPADDPGLTDRLPLEAIVHREAYSNYSSADIDRLYQEKESLPLTASLLEINQLETLAQIFTQKRYTKKDNEFFSEKYLEVIRKQGFMK